MCWLGQILNTTAQLQTGSLHLAGRKALAAHDAQTVTSYPVSQYGRQAHTNLRDEIIQYVNQSNTKYPPLN